MIANTVARTSKGKTGAMPRGSLAVTEPNRKDLGCRTDDGGKAMGSISAPDTRDLCVGQSYILV